MKTPSPFSTGEIVLLKLDDGRELTFTILKPLAPFLRAQTLLARCADLSPSTVVLKIFDPRFYHDRFEASVFTNYHARPWTPDAEAVAVEDHEPLQWGDTGDAVPQELLIPGEPDPSTVEGPAALCRAARWEKVWQHKCMESFPSEVTAYRRLQSLQGTAIPRLLGTGCYIPSERRVLKPPALVLEYIDGFPLVDAPVAVLTPSLIAQLSAHVQQFLLYGVAHNDLHARNILLTPPRAPQRAVVIDFGDAFMREDQETDEQWNEVVRENGADYALSALLASRYIPWQPGSHVEKYSVRWPDGRVEGPEPKM